MSMTRSFRTWLVVLIPLAALAIGSVALAADPGGAGAGSGPPRAAAMRARFARMRAAAVQAQLDEAAARLEIRASQESAWNAFSTAVKAMAEPPAQAGQRPANVTAAALVQREAMRAMSRAQRLSQLADATGKLQAVLSPDQREVLTQIVRMRIRADGMGGMRRFGRRRGMIIRRGRMGPMAFFRFRTGGPGQGAPGPGPGAGASAAQ